jgi:hypothetical protein
MFTSLDIAAIPANSSLFKTVARTARPRAHSSRGDPLIYVPFGNIEILPPLLPLLEELQAHKFLEIGSRGQTAYAISGLMLFDGGLADSLQNGVLQKRRLPVVERAGIVQNLVLELREFAFLSLRVFE